MRLCSFRPVPGELDDPGFDDDAALAIGGIAVARCEHPPDTGAAANSAAVEGRAAQSSAGAPDAAGERDRAKHLMQVALTSLAATRADFPDPGFEVVVLRHVITLGLVVKRPATNMAAAAPQENRRHFGSAKSAPWGSVAPSASPWRHSESQKQMSRQTLARHLPGMAPLFHLAIRGSSPPVSPPPLIYALLSAGSNVQMPKHMAAASAGPPFVHSLQQQSSTVSNRSPTSKMSSSA
jgi:hypothetical protein